MELIEGYPTLDGASASLPILFVDDEESNRRLFQLAFADEFPVLTAPGGAEALALLAAREVGVLVSDERMPGMSGIELLSLAFERFPDTVRIIVSAYGDAARLLGAMNRGHAHEYLLKPWDRDELRECLVRSLAIARRRRELRRKAELADVMLDAASTEQLQDDLVGWSGGLRKIAATVDRAAATNVTVLLTGETGTGKEQIARRIHFKSTRRSGPFVAVHCGALAETLIESELFGHEAGAFTGAGRTRKGRFEHARGGTLFLDEIGDISQHIQLALLRVLQERTIERVGGSRIVPIDVRIISATHRDLRALVREGRFREDLHYRINVFPIEIPPLRERSSDIEALVLHFVARHRHLRPDGVAPKVSRDALEVLRAYRWPGNVRELENMVQRAMVLCDGDELSPDDFTFAVPESPPFERIRDEVAQMEAARLHDILLSHGGNLSKAARAIGIPRTTLMSRAKRLGLL